MFYIVIARVHPMMNLMNIEQCQALKGSGCRSQWSTVTALRPSRCKLHINHCHLVLLNSKADRSTGVDLGTAVKVSSLYAHGCTSH